MQILKDNITDKQLKLFQAKKFRDLGIKKSFENAEIHNKDWGKCAYLFLLEYIKTTKEFMAEDVRIASEGIIKQPPSKRAWGYIFVLAKKNKIIKSIGFSNVKNPKAHRTPATLWAVVNNSIKK
tara:strand:- start:306 stop:677 length:372 start_codon:yes stop_codon:yes gene_type:complete